MLIPSFNPYNVSTNASIEYSTIRLYIPENYQYTRKLEFENKWRFQVYPSSNHRNIPLVVVIKNQSQPSS